LPHAHGFGNTFTSRFLAILMPFFLGSCSGPNAIPQWFDAVHRLPVHTVLVQDHRIAYLDVGHGSPVILIHGYGGSLWQWEYQQGPLSAEHRVITLDLLGSGFSDKPDLEYTPAILLDSFRRFMDALNIPHASLVGNSMGAGLAIAMAVSDPERVDRVVLISGFPERIREKLSSPMMRRAIDSRTPVWLVKFGNWLLGRGITDQVLSEMVHDHSLLTPTVLDRSYRNRKRSGLIEVLLSLSRNLQLWEDGFAKRLGEMHQPTLILWGERDKVFPPKVGQDLQALVPGAAFELIPEAGHIPMWERPDLVNPLLLKFLQP
jgi:pimeloyl-ACP methyl ester carboxylesterase